MSQAESSHSTQAVPASANNDIFRAHARVNGWAWWRTLEYHDFEEEAAFVAADFQSMLRFNLGVHWYA